MVNIIKSVEELNGLDIGVAGVIPFSFQEGELYFLFGREAKNNKKEDRALWGDFGGTIRKEKEKNFEGLVREFWEETNGLFGTVEGIRSYINENFSKLLIVHCEKYNGVIVFLPMEYEKKYERMFHTQNILYKHVLDTKKEIQRARSRGLLEKDLIQWYTMAEIMKQKKKFRKCNHDIIDFMNETFNPSL